MKKTNFVPFCIVLLFATVDLRAQNVGIGLPNPTRAKLEVNGVAGSGATSGIFGGDGTGISLQRSWPTIGFNQYRDLVTPGSQGRYMANGFAAIQYFDPGSGTMAFDMFQNGTAGFFTPTANRAITILNSGNVGIHSGGSIAASLYVTKGSNFDGSAVFAGTTHGSYFNHSLSEHTYIRAGKDGGSVYINDVPNARILLGNVNGRVGINDFAPTHTLSITQVNESGIKLLNTEANLYWELRNITGNQEASETVFAVIYSGHPNPLMGWFRPDNGAYFSNSDIRLKENIHPLEPVLEKVLQLRPCRYQMKNSSSNRECIGFIAQEAKRLFPEMVDILRLKAESNSMGIPDHHAINYGEFSVVAIRAIQEQQALIQSQQKQIDELRKAVEELKRR